MALMLHRAERSDVLVRRLADVLAAVPTDPFLPDVVSVPSKGVERWIAQSLSSLLGGGERADGVCANVVFPSPGALVRDALAAASDIDPDEDPWAERRLPWPLLEVIDGCATEAWCRTLGRHLGVVGGGWFRDARFARSSTTRGCFARSLNHPRCRLSPARRMAVAQKLAGLFTAYGAERPSMLLAWAAGDDSDGYGDPLDPDLAWQAELWRRLRDHIGVPSPAERIEPACARLREEARPRRPPGTAVGLRADPADHHPAQCPRRARRAARRPPLASAPLGRPVASRRRLARRGWCCRAPRRSDGGGAGAPAGAVARSGRPRDAGPARGPHRRRGGRARPCAGDARHLAGRAAARPAPRRGSDRRPSARRGRPQHPGARLPRSAPAGRGAARGAARAARGRPDARAARHHRDVPGHRGLRAVDQRQLRGGGGRE